MPIPHSESSASAWFHWCAGQPQRRVVGRVIVACLSLLLISSGCERTRTLDEQGYAFAQSLYGVCSRKDEARLTQLIEQLEEAMRTGELSTGEYRQLQPAFGLAQRGEWQAARESVHQLMQRQVLRSG